MGDVPAGCFSSHDASVIVYFLFICGPLNVEQFKFKLNKATHKITVMHPAEASENLDFSEKDK